MTDNEGETDREIGPTEAMVLQRLAEARLMADLAGQLAFDAMPWWRRMLWRLVRG